jgi:autotransporter-associated beta strand protein
VGGIILNGAGTLELNAVNTFTGGVTIDSGTLDLAVAGAGGSGPVTFAAGSSGDVVEFNNALGQCSNVFGSDGTVDLNLADVNLSGGGDTITSGRRSSANLSNTNGDQDTFHGSFDTVGVNDAQVSVIGRSNTITATAGSLVRNSNTGTEDDTVTGSDVTLVLNNAETTLNGSSDTVRFASSDAVIANGQSDAFVLGADFGVSSITGFEANERLRLSVADWSNFAALQASGDLFQSNNNVVIEIGATNMLTLVNTQLSEFSATNVKFQ